MTRKIKVKLTELKDATVDYVSLVERAASRLPVRIMKQENTMLDLGKIALRALKGESAKPQVQIAALVTNGHDEATTAKLVAALKAEGFETGKVTKNEDGTMMYAQVENPLENATVIKASDELLVVVKGFDSSCCEPGASQGGDFNDQVNARGFLPGVSTAMDVMYSSVLDALYSSSSPSEAQGKIKEVTAKFDAYVGALAGNLPTKAFKAESVVGAALKAAKAEVATKPAEEVEEQAAAAASAAASTEAQPAATEPAAQVQKAEEKPAATETQKSDMDKLVEMVTGLTKTVGEITQKFDTVSGELASLKEAQGASERRVDEFVKKAETLGQTVNTTILASAPAPDQTSGRAVKQEVVENADPRTGVFDTGFMPNNGRPTRR
jgi:hypothetical protein